MFIKLILKFDFKALKNEAEAKSNEAKEKQDKILEGFNSFINLKVLKNKLFNKKKKQNN